VRTSVTIDPHGDVRDIAAFALGKIGSLASSAVPAALIEALRGPDSDVRDAVTEAIRRIEPDLSPDLVESKK
jgi:HEAT repeat protein